MITYRTTKFKNLDRMQRAFRVAVGPNQRQIDAAFTDASGNPKPPGTSKIISHNVGVSLGVGYELDSNMNVVPISAPLQEVVLSLVVSGSFELMVETAYLEP